MNRLNTVNHVICIKRVYMNTILITFKNIFDLFQGISAHSIIKLNNRYFQKTEMTKRK